ncbi:MAG: HupE/UreJ family protein [Phycisphaerales bacterium]
MIEPFRRSSLTARAAFFLGVLAALLCFGRGARAHPPVATAAIVKVSPSGEVDLTLTHDVLAFALNDQSQNIPDGPMFDLLNGPEEVLAPSLREAATRFESLCVLTAGGTRVPLRVLSYPSAAEVYGVKAKRAKYPLPIKLELHATASIPADSTSLKIRFPEMLGIVVVTIDRPGAEPVALPLEPNEPSPDFELSLRAADSGSPTARDVSDDLAKGHDANRASGAKKASDSRKAGSVAGASGTKDGDAESDPPKGAASKRSDGTGWLNVFKRFAILGFEHIIPGGPDHALFVLGLFLLSPKPRPVILQISAFTVAHTITLTLTSLNIIGLSPSIVEPTIAASVAFVGIENLCTTKVHAWRSGVAFLFGLVHGMGVASAFNEAGFPPGQLVSSLAAFTVGVEGGHLGILAAAFLFLGWTSRKTWYRGRIAMPLSLAISLIALAWLVQRLGA